MADGRRAGVSEMRGTMAASEQKTGAGPALEVDGLVKRFGDLTAVDGVSLTVRAGECLGLLGPNGAGKSTVIRSMVGRVIQDSGRVMVMGQAAGSTAARMALGMGSAGAVDLSADQLQGEPGIVWAVLRTEGAGTERGNSVVPALGGSRGEAE